MCEGVRKSIASRVSVITLSKYPLFLVRVFWIWDPTTGRWSDLFGFESAPLWRMQSRSFEQEPPPALCKALWIAPDRLLRLPGCVWGTLKMNAQNEGNMKQNWLPYVRVSSRFLKDLQHNGALWWVRGNRLWFTSLSEQSKIAQRCALGGRAAKERFWGAPQYSSLEKLVSSWCRWVSLDEGKFIIVNFSSPRSLLCVQGDRCATSSWGGNIFLCLHENPHPSSLNSQYPP